MTENHQSLAAKEALPGSEAGGQAERTPDMGTEIG